MCIVLLKHYVYVGVSVISVEVIHILYEKMTHVYSMTLPEHYIVNKECIYFVISGNVYCVLLKLKGLLCI